MFENEYISLESVAAQLNLPKAYLKRLSDTGKIPYLAVGSRKRFQEKDVREALSEIEQQVIQQTPPKEPKRMSFLTGILRERPEPQKSNSQKITALFNYTF